MKAKITTKGQITIPLEIRRKLNLKPGQFLEFDPKAAFVKATKIINEKQMRSLVGSCKATDKLTSKDLIDQMRGEVELP